MIKYTLKLMLVMTLCAPSFGCDQGTKTKNSSTTTQSVTSPSSTQKKLTGAKSKGAIKQGGADAGPRGDAQKGESVYLTYCSACHQKDGKAMGGLLGANFVDDTTRLAKPDSVLLKSIREGITGKLVMPPQKDILSAEQIKDVLAYIRKTFGGPM
jgi:mono/diheme cytochrome c family protein